jgi:predicted GIY-YIG superfamily endonuclease
MDPPSVSDILPGMAAKNFPNAVVYVLQCIDNYYYIGSTINNPRYRLNNHKSDSITYPDRCVYKHINAIGWENVKLQVVEAFPCDTKEELRKKEDELIKDSLQDEYCLNHIRVVVSKEERRENVNNYYLTHREQIIEQHRTYLEANKEKVDAYHANYRKENAEERREYSRQYAAEHPEQVKAARKAHYEENKAEILGKQYFYAEANKEAIQNQT